MNVLFLDSYTRPGADSSASDEIGYGISASAALKDHLRRLGLRLHDLAHFGLRTASRIEWVHKTYELIRECNLTDYDVVFVFHCMHQFPTEVRRILCDRGRPHLRIVGYTHGSHWDPTDSHRTIHYPGLRLADLANICAMDRVFVVSDYFRAALLRNVSAFSRSAAAELTQRIRVTGLPINDAMLDAARKTPKPDMVRILFNHSATDAKAPGVFFDVMERVMALHDVELLVTRRFDPATADGAALDQLSRRYGPRVHCGNTMTLEDYYGALWRTHIQVSTARHESLGIATLEAMYAYNCCLLPNRLSYSEIGGRSALYESVADLERSLGHLILDATARDTAAQAMHRRSLRYLPSVVAGKIASIIHDLVADRGAGT